MVTHGYHTQRMTETESDTDNGTEESDHSRWKMGTGKASRRKEKPVGHMSRTPDGHYKKDKGPDLKSSSSSSESSEDDRKKKKKAQCCPKPDKPVEIEAKQPERVPVRAITRSSGVVIEELPVDEPTSSKLNPKAKEWEQSRSTWKEKGKSKEFDEWKEQREMVAKITENLSKKKLEIPECSEARTVQTTPILRIQQLTIELEDIKKSLPTVDKFIKLKKKQVEAMTVEVPQIKDDEVPVIQVDYKNKKQLEPMSGVILDGGAGVSIIGEHMKEKMGITNYKPAPFRVRMANQCIVQPSGLLENLHIKVVSESFKTSFLILDVQGAYGMLLGRPWLISAKAVQDYANQVVTIEGSQNRIHIKTNNTRK
ncbi:hypothetical protein L7F22_051203 [Adiantum nelumboides]|nr:hypothetical protein [Adiantum nelumboides]